MAGIAVQNFLSARAGVAVAIALICGLARHGITTIGTAPFYVLLPICVLVALILAWQGPTPDLTVLIEIGDIRDVRMKPRHIVLPIDLDGVASSPNRLMASPIVATAG